MEKDKREAGIDTKQASCSYPTNTNNTNNINKMTIILVRIQYQKRTTFSQDKICHYSPKNDISNCDLLYRPVSFFFFFFRPFVFFFFMPIFVFLKTIISFISFPHLGSYVTLGISHALCD